MELETNTLEENVKSVYYNQALLRAVMEGIPDAVSIKDLAGRYVMLNRAATRSLRKSELEVIGKRDLELFAPDLAQRMMRDDHSVVESGATQTFEETQPFFGLVRTYLITKGPIRGKGGDIIGTFAISRDITALKRTEEKLREAEARYRTLLDHLPVITYVGALQDDVATLSISPRMAPVLALSPEELDDPYCWVNHIHADDRERVIRDFRKTQEQGLATANEYRFLTGKEEALRIRDSRGLVRNEAAEPQFIEGIMFCLDSRSAGILASQN